jgi:hypothetical protein
MVAFAAPSHAQLLDQLKGGLGGGGGGALGGMGLPSVGQAPPSNISGLLTYCIKNKYLGGGAGGVSSALMGKLSGSSAPPNDAGYRSGANGLLDLGGGKSYNLAGNGGGGGLQQQMTNKLCDMVLDRAKGML